MKIAILVWIQFFASQHGVDPMLVEAIVRQESSYNPQATGSIGEIGLMQMRKEYLTKPNDYYQPYLNLKEGIKRLAELKRHENVLGPYWFVAWNAGSQGALVFHKTNGIENHKYSRMVMMRYAEIMQEHDKRPIKIQYKEHTKLKELKTIVAFNGRD